MDDKQAFVADIARKHGARLQRYLAARLNVCAQDVPDLVQEVYLRLMRVPHHEGIRSPQAYLYTMAFHVMYQYKLGRAEVPEAVDALDALTDPDHLAQEDPATLLENEQQLSEMDRVLMELAPNVRATFVLSRHYGFTLEEIAGRLGVSRGMCKKYLAKAITHFRLYYEEKESQA